MTFDAAPIGMIIPILIIAGIIIFAIVGIIVGVVITKHNKK